MLLIILNIKYTSSPAVSEEKIQDFDSTISVRSAPKQRTANPTKNTIEVFNNRKKSKAPLIIAASLVTVLFVGGGLFEASKLHGNVKDKDKDEFSESSEQKDDKTAAGDTTQPLYIEYLKNAEQGDVNEQCLLGSAYYYGMFDAEQDSQEAVKWYQKAADRGNINAKTALERIS